MKKKLLHSYLNGNVRVELFEDGTKTQEWPGDTYADANPEYPVSMDVKITNYCDLGCKFCHEESTTNGKHCDTYKLIDLLCDLPEGTELALGGGNPLDHPDIELILRDLREYQLIPNMTVNYKHIPKYHDLINYFIENKLIYGLGISVDSKADPSKIESFIDDSKNVVYHIIAGVEHPTIIKKYKDKKVLILGYKDHGRGVQYRSQEVTENIMAWDMLLPTWGRYPKIASFDNLAVKQLNLKDRLSEEQWKKQYMGSDGQFTMYVDAVNYKYATSSTSTEQFDIKASIDLLFGRIRKINKF